MSYIRHHTIVVTGRKDTLLLAHEEAVRRFTAVQGGVDKGCLASPIVPGWINGEGAFFIAPDQSKEGWDTSDLGDEARAQFVAWLRHTDLEWVELEFGTDGGVPKVLHHPTDRRRNK